MKTTAKTKTERGGGRRNESLGPRARGGAPRAPRGRARTGEHRRTRTCRRAAARRAACVARARAGGPRYSSGGGGPASSLAPAPPAFRLLDRAGSSSAASFPKSAVRVRERERRRRRRRRNGERAPKPKAARKLKVKAFKDRRSSDGVVEHRRRRTTARPDRASRGRTERLMLAGGVPNKARAEQAAKVASRAQGKGGESRGGTRDEGRRGARRDSQCEGLFRARGPRPSP